MKRFLSIFLAIILGLNTFAADAVNYNSPGAGNPILPGWFADPTIKKFGDIYYIYATTDNEMLASGAPTVWYSKDFQNWYNYTMEIPSLSSLDLRNFWAPDIVQGNDGRYYLYFGNCQITCVIYGYVSDSPVGPWVKLNSNDAPVINTGDPVSGFPSLDAQFLRDDDGLIYGYWGTWVEGYGGYGVGKLDTANMNSVSNTSIIPKSGTPGPMEAAYPMKKNDKYILMYSNGGCQDETYNIRYSYSDSPTGSFIYGENNPILSTNADKTVHGPGHHSVIEEGETYYILYHRHDIPFTAGGHSRQVCADSLIFINDSTIQTVEPTHEGITPFIASDAPDNIAYTAAAGASSYYHMQSLDYDYVYKPEYATDDNNATMWKAANNSFPQSLGIDLGSEKSIARIMTSFEFASYFYQYTIEYSSDSASWSTYIDRSTNKTPGSPMIDDNSVTARYLRINVLGTEQTGDFAAIWNMKVYESTFDIPLPTLQNVASGNDPGSSSTNSQLVSINLDTISYKLNLSSIPNEGTLGGNFTKTGTVQMGWEPTDSIKALLFTSGSLKLDGISVPKSLAWNGAYTVAVWANNPSINSSSESLATWCDRYEWNLANSYQGMFFNNSGYGAAAHLHGYFDMGYNSLPSASEWHHLVLTFDGVVEKVYVDGVLDNSQHMHLSSAIENASIIIGNSDSNEPYTGYIASVQMYDSAFTAEGIVDLMNNTKPKAVAGPNAPTDLDLALDVDPLPEDTPRKTEIGTFSTTDPNYSEGHVYSLVSGDGDDNNIKFTISNDRLVLDRTLDYETTPTALIRIRSSNTEGGYVEKSFSITISETTAIKQTKTNSDEIVLYPNPFKQSATIKLLNDDEMIENLKIIDVVGKTVKSYNSINSNQCTIEKDNLKSGIYYVMIEATKNYYMQISIQ